MSHSTICESGARLPLAHRRSGRIILLCLVFAIGGLSARAQDVNELYVINGMAETLDKIDLVTGTVAHDVAVLGLYPNRLYVNDTMVVVVNSGDANLQLIRLADYSTIGYIHFNENDNPYDLTVIDGAVAYVSLFGSHEVALCDLAARIVVARVAVGYHPEGVLVAGDHIYVVNTAFDDVEFQFKQGTMYVIDRSTFVVTDSVYTARNPQALTLAPDGTIHILCTGNYIDEFGRVDILDPSAMAIVDHVDLGGSPGIIHVDRFGNAYLADWGWGVGYLYKYDMNTRTVIHDRANPIAPGHECAFVTGDMSNNLYVCAFNVDKIAEYDKDDTPTGRNFPVGDGPLAAALLTNRLPGDVKEDGAINPVDVVCLVNHVYKGIPLPDRPAAADINHDCAANPVDVVMMVNFVYKNYGTLLWGCMP